MRPCKDLATGMQCAWEAEKKLTTPDKNAKVQKLLNNSRISYVKVWPDIGNGICATRVHPLCLSGKSQVTLCPFVIVLQSRLSAY